MSDIKVKDKNKPSGPVKLGKFRVTVDRDLCIGAATCIAIAPKVFGLDRQAKAIILDSSDEEKIDTIIDAARGCPTAAIIIKDESGKVIYPK